MHNIVDFGAVPDGKTLASPAIQAAIDHAAALGGGTVHVPAGTWLCGALTLKNKIRLFLDAGSTILASTNPEHYPVIQARWEGSTRESFAPLLGGQGLVDVSIEGRGTIDGQGKFWWDWFKTKTMPRPRPRLVSFQDCQNLLLSGFTAKNSPSWTINPVRCSNLLISGLSIFNPADSPNTDGINPDSCSSVRISDCFVSVGDDCITIKSGTEHEAKELQAPCEDISITNCILERGHGAIVIGSEMSGGVRNVVISNCIFKGTDRGIRIKTRRGRGGMVEDILVNNIIMDRVPCPITINLYYGCGAWGDFYVSAKTAQTVTELTPGIRNIHLANIEAKNSSIAGIFAYGLPERPVENISFSNVRISMDPSSTEAQLPEMADGLPTMCKQGLWARNVTGLALHNVHFYGQSNKTLDLDESVQILTQG